MNIKQMGIDSKIRILMMIALSSSMLQSPYSMAAKDGELDSTSTGQVGVSLKTGHLVKISGLSDINLPWDASAAADGTLTDVSGVVDYCVYTNKKDGKGYKYSMSVSSANAGDEKSGEFTLKGSQKNNSDLIGYHVYATGTGGVSQAIAFSAAHAKWGEGSAPSGTSVNFGGDNKEAIINCKGAKNARMWVVANTSDVIGATPDSYEDTLTLMVSAD